MTNLTGNIALIVDVAEILKELFNFDGSIEELCAMSEGEGQFKYTSDEMLAKLHEFVRLFSDGIVHS